MVFISSHFNTSQSMLDLVQQFQHLNDEIILCGSCNFAPTINNALAYHPIFETQETTSIAQQHAYIDAMLRALQIEVPSTLILHSATLFDTKTVLQRIKEHCEVVGISIILNYEFLFGNE
jgi:hypothetical protein